MILHVACIIFFSFLFYFKRFINNIVVYCRYYCSALVCGDVVAFCLFVCLLDCSFLLHFVRILKLGSSLHGLLPLISDSIGTTVAPETNGGGPLLNLRKQPSSHDCFESVDRVTHEQVHSTFKGSTGA